MLMKFVVILVVCGLLELVLPWYVIAIVPLIICFTAPSSAWLDFLCGFFSIFILWLGVELIFDIPNDGILSSKITSMFHLPSRWILLAVSAAVGGLISGISSLCGNYLRSIGGGNRFSG